MMMSKRMLSVLISVILLAFTFAESAVAVSVNQSESADTLGALWADGNSNVESNG